MKFSYLVTIFVIIILFIFLLRPPYFCNGNGCMKRFGLGKRQVLFTPVHVALAITLFIYLFSL